MIVSLSIFSKITISLPACGRKRRAGVQNFQFQYASMAQHRRLLKLSNYLPGPGFNDGDSYQVSGAKQVPNVISLLSFHFSSLG